MYAVTIKKTGCSNYVDNDYYRPYLSFLSQEYGLVTYSYELDSKHRLHVHAMCEKNPYLKLKEYKKNIMTFCRKIYDDDGWLSYINKVVNANDEDTLLMNQIYHKNCFINGG